MYTVNSHFFTKKDTVGITGKAIIPQQKSWIVNNLSWVGTYRYGKINFNLSIFQQFKR
jgi:hypothetical protein